MKPKPRPPHDPQMDQESYLRDALDCYCRTPGTCGRATREDRRLAARLHRQGLPLQTLQAAFDLAAVRRIYRDPQTPPLTPIRSLHYFLPVLEEILETPLPEAYLEYLKAKLDDLDEDHKPRSPLWRLP